MVAGVFSVVGVLTAWFFVQNELLGRNVNKVTIVDEQSKKEMLSKLFQRYNQISVYQGCIVFLSAILS